MHYTQTVYIVQHATFIYFSLPHASIAHNYLYSLAIDCRSECAQFFTIILTFFFIFPNYTNGNLIFFDNLFMQFPRPRFLCVNLMQYECMHRTHPREKNREHDFYRTEQIM